MSALDRLIGFKYLKRKHILTLALILTLTSTLFSITAFSLLGFYNGFNAYLGEGEDVVALYDRKSSTPFTGLVPAYLAERISSINGVIASSPEAIAPCLLKDEAIFLRGIIPDAFAKLNQITMVDGDMLELGNVNYIIAGKSLAERLNLKPNDRVLVLGVLADQYLELHVKGIYESHSPMDDEALAPLYVGQWLRRTDYGHATLIRFKIDRSVVSPALIFEEVAKEASEPSPDQEEDGQKPPDESIIPEVRAGFRLEDLGVDEAQRFMRSYMDSYGVNKEVILILSVMVFLFSSISISAASKTIITQHKGEINVLRSVGAPKKLLKRDIVIKLLPWSLIASSIGIALATAVLTVSQAYGYLQVLSHAASFQLDPLTTALNFILVSLLVSISILTSTLE
jgi:ABC-type lipoprotein release transport system permease subunit